MLEAQQVISRSSWLSMTAVRRQTYSCKCRGLDCCKCRRAQHWELQKFTRIYLAQFTQTMFSSARFGLKFKVQSMYPQRKYFKNNNDNNSTPTNSNLHFLMKLYVVLTTPQKQKNRVNQKRRLNLCHVHVGVHVDQPGIYAEQLPSWFLAFHQSPVCPQKWVYDI